MPLSDHQQQILTSMGVTLILLQSTEKIINLCMTFVFQNSSRLTLEALELQQKEEQKKTLGYFLRELRKRADLAPEFDQLLRDFLNHRNTFIHKLSDLPGWDLDSPEGRQIAERFISKLTNLNQRVLGIFIGFLRAWERQVGMNTSVPLGSEEFFAEIDRIYTPLIDDLVSKKST